MICNKCGTELPDGSVFCPNCGAALNETPAPTAEPATQYVPMNEQPQYQQAPQQPQQPQYQYDPNNQYQQFAPAPKKKSKGLLIAVIIAAIAILAGVLCFVLLGGSGSGSPEGVAKKAVSAIFDGDADAVIECMNRQYLDAVCEEEGTSISELKAELNQTFSYIKDLGVSYKITGTTVVDSASAQDVIDEYAEYGVTVSEAKTVKVTVEMTLLGQTQSQDMEIPVAKIGGTWYVAEAESMF